MRKRLSCKHIYFPVLGASLVAAIFWMLSCSGGTSSMGGGGSQGTGTVTTSISDPPTCTPPNGSFEHVWVTIIKVEANISSSAGPNDSGWVTLVDLTSAPKQIDLLSLASTTCLLTQLGSSTGLTPGSYQQIRIILLSNSPASGQATPSPNACGSGSYNCVQIGGGVALTRILPLNLSSEAQTGIKIPPGQITGGAIQLQAGQSADINITFNACASIVQEGNGQVRLIPTLHAGEVAVNNNSISGTVVDSATSKPVPDALVFLEQPDSNGVDRVFTSGMTDSTGSFIFCPLPSGKYDVVVAASVISGGVTTTYNATLTSSVPLGTALTKIPLVAENGSSSTTLPATITGQVTSSNTSNAGTAADVQLSALQQVTISGQSTLQITTPVFGGSPSNVQPALSSFTPNVETANGSGCPTGTACASYTLLVPASNPEVGVWSSSGTSYSRPSPSNVNYTINGEAFVPGSGGTPDCNPSSATTRSFTVSLTTPTTAPTLPFTGCQ